MTRSRIALIDASHGHEYTARNFRRELDGSLTRYDASGGDLPDGFDFDGVVISGSRASVYDDEPWIDATAGWVRGAVDRGLPTLGVCWGHQLLASALGGRVESMDEYELGYRTVSRTDADNAGVLAGLPEEFTVFETHSDEVVELPPGATPLAENDRSIQAFRLGTAFGVQFHPEYDPETARDVVSDKDSLGEDRKQAVLDGITDEAYARACETKRLFENFVAYVDGERAPVAD
ncbi:hypothetical protein BRD17_06345 [Halobacteriales archaeon SW_7_68_16]|nr:MAG: hypothetical protein BRD17_06345 [Halobacteriales archaeon SW_7_68_16]